MAALTRRRLILAGAAAGAGVLLVLQPELRPGPLRERLLRVVGGSPALREPDLTGTLEPVLADRLWALSERIAARWSIADNLALDRQAFDGILAAKTGQRPSYLAEYREAAGLLGEDEAWRHDDAALDALFSLPLNVYRYNETRLGRLQRFVIGEFIELQLAFGGFRAFGYRNYRGFAGGPLSGAGELPYRAR